MALSVNRRALILWPIKRFQGPWSRRNGHDWSGRFPLITETALRSRNSSFVLDGEAVPLGVNDISDFNGLHSRVRTCGRR
jgi:hypothetical protein